MKQAHVQLDELLGEAGSARLQAAAAARARLHVDCAAAARLPAAFIGAALAAGAGGAVLCLDGLAPAALKAVEAIDRAGVLAVGAPGRAAALAVPPLFSVDIRGDQLELRVLAPARGAASAAMLAHDWLRGVSCSRLDIDLGAIEHLDSLLVAWLLQLSQAAAPAKVLLLHVSAQAATQLRQLRLNHLMAIT
jgi:hypothetical protein